MFIILKSSGTAAAHEEDALTEALLAAAFGSHAHADPRPAELMRGTSGEATNWVQEPFGLVL